MYFCLSLFLSFFVLTTCIGDFSTSFSEFTKELNIPGNDKRFPKTTLDTQLKKRVEDFEKRIKQDYEEFTKKVVGLLAYAVRNAQKVKTMKPWEDLSAKAEKTIAASREKIEKLSKSFQESTFAKLDSLKFTDSEKSIVAKLQETWNKEVSNMGTIFDKFSQNLNKFAQKLSSHPQTHSTTPIMKCGDKEYLLLNFVPLIDGNTLHQLEDIENIQDWVNWANTVGVSPCNGKDQKWEKVVAETKDEL